jgi:hypothetical protein
MRRKVEYATAIFLLAVHALGCASDELTGTRLANQPPKVWLAGGPPEGAVTSYRVHLYWGGWDPDGHVEHYEYAITDNESGIFDPADTTGADKWHRTSRTDSTFLLSADVLADSSVLDSYIRDRYEFVRSHTFFVRAIDDRGSSSTEPAYQSFTARSLSPEVDIVTPIRTLFNPAILPPVITFEWTARDIDSEAAVPDSVRWILVSTITFNSNWDDALAYIRANPHSPDWSDWHYYKAPGDSGKSTTTDPPLAQGNYLFAVQVKDEAGAVSPVFDLHRNVRRVAVTKIVTGPVLSVSYKYMNNIVTANPNTPPAILELPAGIPVGFSWSADASSYGGTVHGYRYGWDIIDLNDPSQWEIDFTPFVGSRAQSPTRTFFFGTHTFFLEVVDNSGLKTRATVVANIVPFTMRRSLLVVDDWVENSTGFRRTLGVTPSDNEHDAFWVDMVSDVADFVPAVDVWHLEDGVKSVPVQVLANYKSIIWNARGSYSVTTGAKLHNYVKFIHPDPSLIDPEVKLTPNLVEMFMEVGGHVLLCGENVMTTVINRDLITQLTGRPASIAYPFIFRYELTGDQRGAYLDSEVGFRGIGDESFAYDECCLNVVDIAFTQNPRGVRRSPLTCPVDMVRDRDQRTDGLRACIPMDDSHAFPRMTLRPEVSALGRWYHESRLGLNCDIYNPPYLGTLCNHLAELSPQRSCFQPIYGLDCLNTSSAIFGAPVAFWTARFATRVPRGGGVPARSAVWGFEPVYFNPSEVKQALEIILFDEWQLPREQ